MTPEKAAKVSAKLDKRLEGQIQVEASRHLRSQADEVMYHHKLGGEQRNDGMEFDNVRDLQPEKFEGVAGMESAAVHLSNPSDDYYTIGMVNKPEKLELRRCTLCGLLQGIGIRLSSAQHMHWSDGSCSL